MKSHRMFVFVSMAVVLLVACNSSTSERESKPGPVPAADVAEEQALQEPALASAEESPAGDISLVEEGGPQGEKSQTSWPDGEARLDEQGFVEVAVTPLNLNAPDETLKFSVGLNTHSIDLSMDLAQLATLEADNGRDVQALLWDAPRGGHHVSGVLSFPTVVDGAKLLEDATRLTLKIMDLNVAERSFTWSLTG